MISSVAKISKGGEKSNFRSKFKYVSQAFGNLHQLGMHYLSFTVINDLRYDSGVCLSWITNGSGVSSVYANFTLKVPGIAANVAVDYAVNITTAVMINGSCTSLGGEEKLVNLTCGVFNEVEHVLAENITLFYENLGSWIPVNSSNSLSTVDYGNRTYCMSFRVDVPSDRYTFLLGFTTCVKYLFKQMKRAMLCSSLNEKNNLLDWF